MTNEIPQVTLNNGVQMPVARLRRLPDARPSRRSRRSTRPSRPATARSTPRPPTGTRKPSAGPSRAAASRASELFVTTKLWIQRRRRGQRQARVRARPSSGSAWTTGPVPDPPALGDYYSSWRAMQEAAREGLAKAIGVANFHPDRLVDLIDHNEVTPAVNQIETHPFFQRPPTHELMREHGVQIESWGPFAEGQNNIFSDRPSSNRRRARQEPRPGRAALAHPARRRRHPQVGPTRSGCAENIDVFDFELTEDEMARDRRAWTPARSLLLRPPRPRDGRLAQQPRRLTLRETRRRRGSLRPGTSGCPLRRRRRAR